jgi:IMP cyclohydrolase
MATITLRGLTLNVRSLTFAEVRAFRNDGTLALVPWNSAAVLSNEEAQDAAVRIILAAAKGDHPDLTAEKLEAALELDALDQVMPTVLGASGLVRKAAAAPGEAVSP